MKTRKLTISILYPNQNREDEHAYIPVTFYENNGNTGENSYQKTLAVPEYEQLHSQITHTFRQLTLTFIWR